MLCRLGWAWECHGFRSEHQQLRRKTTSFSCFGKERRCSFFGSIHVVTGSWPLQKMANLETFNVEGSHHRQDDDSSFVQRAQTQTTSFVLASHDAAGRGSSYVYVPSKGVLSRVKLIVKFVVILYYIYIYYIYIYIHYIIYIYITLYIYIYLHYKYCTVW